VVKNLQDYRKDFSPSLRVTNQVYTDDLVYNFYMSLINLIPFSISTWLGLFLLTRGSNNRLRFAALGLLFYAIALASNTTLSNALRLFPPIFWVGAILFLDQRITDKHPILIKLWKWFLIPLTVIVSGFFLIDSSFLVLKWASLFIGLTPLFFILFLFQDLITFLPSKQATGVLIIATLFFALGMGFLFLPVDPSIQQYVLPAIGFDLLLLGFCMAWFDALDEGETFLPTMTRSFILTTLLITIIAGQVGFVIAIQTGFTKEMQLLLSSTVFVSILISVFGNALQGKLDAVVWTQSPAMQEKRKSLQIESTVLSRKNLEIDLSKLNEEERTRLTRRALSHFGDLTRLASNPLTQLPIIAHELKIRNVPDSTLERATQLKAVLTKSILKLKPQSEKMFDSTDEWRFYNSVYFPYVAGLRLYNRNQEKELKNYEKEAIDWFQAFVPERTLHNWQNTAAKLIANDLWENNF
jgi:hypothetical protein